MKSTLIAAFCAFVFYLSITEIIQFDDQSNAFGYKVFALCGSLLVFWLVVRQIRYWLSIHWVIDTSLRKAERNITLNEMDVLSLRDKINAVKELMYGSKKIAQPISDAVLDNISVWEDQILLHKDIIRLYEKRKAKL